MRRLEKAQDLREGRNFRTERKARTRHLIELGGLVVKARLVELTDDDRAAILGACSGNQPTGCAAPTSATSGRPIS